MKLPTFFARTFPAAGVIACSGLLFSAALAALTPAASAAVGPCKSDPVLKLSNGKTITLYETITDNTNDVTGGKYVLHIPKGVSVTSASWSGAVGSSQSFTWSADQNATSYAATSDVLTKTANIKVTAYMVLTSGKKTAPSTSTNGVSNTAIANSLVSSI